MTVGLETEALEVVDRFFGAIAAGDIDGVRDCYASDAQIWHNFDNIAQTPEENLQLLSYVADNWVNFRFEDIRQWVVEDGIIRQHMMRGEGPDGAPFETSAMLLLQIANGKIFRIEEYFDPGQLPFPPQE